ncbi:MAG: DUF5719 family protein [Acidimicrobiales bacterium]
MRAPRHVASDSERTIKRWPIVVFLVVALAAGGLADRVGHPAPASSTVTGLRPATSVVPTQATSSAWYCPGGTASADGLAAPVVILANSSARAVSGTVSEIPNQGKGVSVTVKVPARSQLRFTPPPLAQPSDYVAFSVLLDGGGVSVEEELSGPLGATTGACASRTAQNWYFASGSTVQGASDVISLFNPTPTDGVADLSFSTDQGPTTVGDYQGVLVPARSLVVLNLGDHVQTRPQIATSVRARIGRLVVGELQTSNLVGQVGIAMTLGASTLSRTWYFPNAVSAPGANEEYHFFNPSADPAQVALFIGLDQGSSSPLSFTVPPDSELTVPTSGQARILPGTKYHARVQVVNDVAIAAERTLSAPSGLVAMMGASFTARAWYLAQGITPPTYSGSVVVLNPGPTPVEVSISVFQSGAVTGPGPSPGVAPVKVPAGGRLALALPAAASTPGAGLMVSSTSPIVVERDLVERHGKGLSAQIAMPAAWSVF